MKSCELLTPQINSCFPLCFDSLSPASNPSTTTHSHTYPHPLHKGGNQEMWTFSTLLQTYTSGFQIIGHSFALALPAPATSCPKPNITRSQMHSLSHSLTQQMFVEVTMGQTSTPAPHLLYTWRYMVNKCRRRSCSRGTYGLAGETDFGHTVLRACEESHNAGSTREKTNVAL